MDKILHVKDYVLYKLEDITATELATILGTSTCMVTNYKKHKYNASLPVAKRVYKLEGVVLHPFSEDSLKWENDNELN